MIVLCEELWLHDRQFARDGIMVYASIFRDILAKMSIRHVK